MNKKAISALLAAAAAAGGALLFWKQRPAQERVVGRTVEEVPTSATSLSAQPHKRVRIKRPVANTTREVPAPDSAEEGRTPYYFVPGEVLIVLHGEQSPEPDFMPQVAERFGATYLPVGEELVSYPGPEGAGWFTIVRLRWDEEQEYEETLHRFVKVEHEVNQRIEWETQRVASWMPNWLGSVAAAERFYTPGGPGAYPRPSAAPEGERLPLVEAPFLQAWREAMAEPVTLAVLDSFPEGSASTDTAVPPVLAPVLDQLRRETRQLTVDGEQHYATFRTGNAFPMSDHGLMATWLATEVIGEAGMAHVTVEPVRIATAEGVCSVADVIAGLAPLARRARDGETLVVLLAFVMGMGDIIPPRLRPYEEHYEGLRLACLSISEAGGTLIGAAGNDASGLQHPPRTRIPASFRSVIEVTAGQLSQSNLALYANQAKALCLFGGESNLQNEMADNLPPLVGPGLAPQLRVSRDELEANETGWVAWAGTSFAAALAAGLAVLLRSQQPSLKMWDVRTRLRELATDRRQPGNVPFIDLVRPARD